MAAGRAKVKRARLTGAQRKANTEFARGVTGYGPSSPIWGKRLPEVLTMIGDTLDYALDTKTNNEDTIAATAEARALVSELAKRIATYKISAGS